MFAPFILREKDDSSKPNPDCMLNMRMVEESMKVMSATGRFRVHMSMAAKKGFAA
jgi:hypothetical protein